MVFTTLNLFLVKILIPSYNDFELVLATVWACWNIIIETSEFIFKYHQMLVANIRIVR